MAHVSKFTRSSVSMLLSHNLRHVDRLGKLTKFQNQEIDLGKSHLNFRLDHNKNPKKYFEKRLSEVKVFKREDVKVYCSWIVTVPKGLPLKKHKNFFESVYNFLEAEVGKENVVIASVHMDETTPHIHFGFVPVVKDKNGREKVCAKEAVNRNYLKTFHKRLQQHLEADLHCSVGVLLPAEEKDIEPTANKLSLRELKRESKRKNAELQRLKEEVSIEEDKIKIMQESPVPKVGEFPLPKSQLFESREKFARRAVDDFRSSIEPNWRALKAQNKQLNEARKKEIEANLARDKAIAEANVAKEALEAVKKPWEKKNEELNNKIKELQEKLKKQKAALQHWGVFLRGIKAFFKDRFEIFTKTDVEIFKFFFELASQKEHIGKKSMGKPQIVKSRGFER